MKSRKNKFILILCSLLFCGTLIAKSCPTISNFSLSGQDQDFSHCTYSSSIINGADINPDLCKKAFEKALAPYNQKESCYYDTQNNACVCKIGNKSDFR